MSSRFKRHTTHNAKPYDRPKTFFQRMASTLHDMLMPSWVLYNSSNSSESNVNQTNPNPNPNANPNLEDNIESQQTLHQSNHQKVLDRSESSDYLNIRNEPSKNIYMPEKRPTYSSYNIEQDKRRREKTQISDLTDNYNNEINQGKTSNLLKSDTLRNNVKLQKKSTHQSFINGDDHSDNSEGSASTSGCSSLVSSHQERKDPSQEYGLQINEEALEHIKKELSKKEEFKNKGVKRHISVETESLSRAAADSNFNQSELHSWYKEKVVCPNKRARPQPTFAGRKPSFNLTSFGAPSLNDSSHSGGSCCHSPFYEGKTTFGGASALNRSHILSSVSYPNTNISNTKLKVKDASSKKDFDYMSTTAKRILLSLEKMSTPLADAKKIPTEKKTFVESYLRQKMNSSSLTSIKPKPQLPLFKPPTSGIMIPSSTMLTKNLDARITSDQITNKIVFTPVSKTSDTNISTTSMPFKSTGKIRARTNATLHCSKKVDMNEIVEVPDLPNVPLPINRLPTFNFNTSSKVLGESGQPKENNEIQFKFSSPIQHNAPPSPPRITNSKEMCFTFSSPVNKENDSMNNSSQNEKSKQEDLTDEKISSSEEKISTATKEQDISIEQKQIKPLGFGDKFKPAPGSWECSACFVRNSKDDVKCISCETPNSSPSVSTQEKSGFLDAKLESNTIPKAVDISSNQEKENNENKNAFSIPSTKVTTSSWHDFGDKFKPPVGSWSCPTCMIYNGETDSKCLSCETPNPHLKSPVADQTLVTSFGAKFKPPQESWECNVCFVPNPGNALRCFACETLRCVTSKPVDSTQLFSGFKFGNKKQNSSFSLENTTFNSNGSGFKFGMTPPSGLNKSTDTFGNKTGDAKPVEGFKFSTPNFATSSSAFTFGGKPLQINSECNNLTNGKIQFGASQNSENSQTTSFGNKALPAFEPNKSALQLFGSQSNVTKSESASCILPKSSISQSSPVTSAVSSIAPMVSVIPVTTPVLSTATTTVSVFSFNKPQPVMSVATTTLPKINAEEPKASANSSTGSFSFTSQPKLVDITNKDNIMPEKVENRSDNESVPTSHSQKPTSTFSFGSVASTTTSSVFKPTTVNNNIFTFGSPGPFSAVSTQQNAVSSANPFAPSTTSQVSFSNFGNRLSTATVTFGHDNNQPKQGFGFQTLPAVQFNPPKSESSNIFRFGTFQEQKQPTENTKSSFTFGASQEQKPPGGDQTQKQPFGFNFPATQNEQKTTVVSQDSRFTFTTSKESNQEKSKQGFNFTSFPSSSSPNVFGTPSTSASTFHFSGNAASPGTPFSFTANPSGATQPPRRIKRAVRRANLGPGRRDN